MGEIVELKEDFGCPLDLGRGPDEQTISGIRIELVAEQAIRIARTGIITGDVAWQRLDDNEREAAKRASRYLDKLRTRGYTKEVARLAFWRQIVAEAESLTSDEPSDVDQAC